MSAWVLAGVILIGAWTQLDEIGWVGWLPLLATLVLDRVGARLPMPRWRPSPPAPAPLVACALLCTLVLTHAALTAREEFGFGGDEGYHLSATRALALYYFRAGPILAASLAVFAVWRWKRWPYAASVAMAALTAGSYLLPASPLFARYPAGFYHLAMPLNVLFDVGGIPYPFTANHIVNALSVPGWLFALRPLIIGRWPDWQVLPVALLIYFQGPALVYLGSSLIEPWAIVFLLLSLEALVALPPEHRWIAVILGSLATVFKETAIFLLPTIWILGCVEWRGFRPWLRPAALALGVAAFTPFAIYYMVRLDADIHRIVAVAAAADVWSAVRIAEWLRNVNAALGVTAVAGVALLFVATLRHVAWSLTTLALVTFFFVDALGVPYTGYSRYLAFALVALSGAVFATTYRTADRRVLIAIPAVLAALQAGPVARAFALDFGPDHERNSLEWNGSLIRLPIRELIGRLSAMPEGAPRSVRVVTFETDLISLPVVYPDLAARYELRREDYAVASSEPCSCKDGTEAVLAVFEWPAHFGDTPDKRAAFEQRTSACVPRIEATCRAVQVERARDGSPVGVIGVGVR
ncbi:MAG: hypothetical protein ACRD1W_05805 [Vicinamibacterales bacterium]